MWFWLSVIRKLCCFWLLTIQVTVAPTFLYGKAVEVTVSCVQGSLLWLSVSGPGTHVVFLAIPLLSLSAIVAVIWLAESQFSLFVITVVPFPRSTQCFLFYRPYDSFKHGFLCSSVNSRWLPVPCIKLIEDCLSCHVPRYMYCATFLIMKCCACKLLWAIFFFPMDLVVLHHGNVMSFSLFFLVGTCRPSVLCGHFVLIRVLSLQGLYAVLFLFDVNLVLESCSWRFYLYH